MRLPLGLGSTEGVIYYECVKRKVDGHTGVIWALWVRPISVYTRS